MFHPEKKGAVSTYRKNYRKKARALITDPWDSKMEKTVGKVGGNWPSALVA